MSKSLNKPFKATAEQVLVLEDILLALADRAQEPAKYGLNEDQLLENNKALDSLNQLMARVAPMTSH